MKSPGLLTAVGCVALGLVAAQQTLPASAAAPVVWVVNNADHVFSSSTRPAGAPATVELDAARGEAEGAQILIRPDSRLTGVQLGAAQALTGPGGAQLPAGAITVRRQYNHPRILVKEGDANLQDGQLPPDGSRNYYDALVDNTAVEVAANYTQAFHYGVTIPAGQAPGVYTGSIAVRNSAGDITVPVRLTVHNVTVPPANQSAFKMNNWFTSVGWDYTGTERAIPFQYDDAAPYSANWWRVIASFARMQAKQRNNVVYADFQALLIRGTTIDANGNYNFDWTNFDRFVQLFVDAGAMQYLYTPTLLESSPDAAHPKLEMLKNVDGVTTKVLVEPNTSESTAYLKKVFPALKAHLDAKGWTDKFYMSALDEPTHPNQAVAARWLYEVYDDYFPKPLTNEAHGYTFLPDAAENITTMTPYTENYEDHAGYWQKARRDGKELWLYTCIVPQHRHMNRLIGEPLAKTRLLPWLVWKIGGQGFLHWGWNYWHRSTGDNNRPYNTFDEDQTGDNYIVRPNKAAYDVYDSIRGEAQRDGQEDFELLSLLAKTKPRTAQAIAESLITDFSVYDRAGATVTNRHQQLLKAIASTAPDDNAVTPLADDFSAGSDNFRFGVNREPGKPAGQWSVQNGELVQSYVGDWIVGSAAVEGRRYRDAVVDADVRITATGGNEANWAGLTLRSINGTDYQTGYLAAIRNNGELFLYRGDKELAKIAVPGYQAGQWTHLRLIAEGTKIRVYAGNSPAALITVTDDSYAEGSVGLVTGGTAARFDNLRINPGTNPAAGGTVTASSSYESDGWSKAALADGNRGSSSLSNGWSSDANVSVNHTETVTVDLGKAVPAGRVDLFPRTDTAAGFPVDYIVEISTDGSAWTKVADRTGAAQVPQSADFAAQQVRYVRVTGTNLRKDPFGAYRMQLAEVEVAGGNYAAGRPVTTTTSSEYLDNGWRRSALTDGITTSNLGYSMGWSSEVGPADGTASATVDLGGATRISQVTLAPRTDLKAGFPMDYAIQVSPDGTTWTTVASRTAQPQPLEPVELTFASTTTRYVRVAGTKLDPGPSNEYRMQLAELTVR
ncbi:hypothetical protein GCM10009745_51880 [Kribbella yunnanensis]|uniref:F5/8 type C domain-containing protein n=1 Tax=Kribbella yunnanensis TaxID=190194 RepID=A0ABN2I5G0_9ACTN